MNKKALNSSEEFSELIAQLAEAVEYTDCISAEGYDECPWYDTKPSDGEALGNVWFGFVAYQPLSVILCKVLLIYKYIL